MRSGNGVVVGLSGGVDSAVCAALLCEQGRDVAGLYLRNVDDGGEAEASARAAAEALDISFSVCDIRADMEARVIRNFRESYLRGHTPNPCVVCNPAVKFPALLREAERLGVPFVATGHYARVQEGRLYRGHPERDQSYMLYRLPRSLLDRLLLPVGMWDKAAVRAYAARCGLAMAGRKDSMDICFVQGGQARARGRYADFLEAESGGGSSEGDFVDVSGRFLGRHRGVHHYTVGQRRGLGLPAERRLYVLALDAERNRVILGGEEGLLTGDIRVEELHWLDRPGQTAFACEVRTRLSPAAHPCRVTQEGAVGAVSLEVPIRRPAPGQSAVFYRGDQVLGGGIVVREERLAAPEVRNFDA